MRTYDAVVIGGGPSGATAATDLARRGLDVLLLDRAGRIKPCGGAIPPRLIKDFNIPDSMLVAKARSARMISPSNKTVDMPIDGGFVGMVDREHFDEFLRERAEMAGAERLTGTFEQIERDNDPLPIVAFRPGKGRNENELHRVRARVVIGADGARSKVAKQEIKGGDKVPCVFAYHEIIDSPSAQAADFDPARCDVYYQGHLSPDFYAWVFPHGPKTSVGLGSANKGFALRDAVGRMREQIGMADAATVRCEGAPIPLKPLKKWDNNKDVVVAGDAAGVVAPASGEGIYYAMLAGRLAADACEEYLETGKARALGLARKRFMKEHGRVFFILGLLQKFWYSTDKRREQFVKICEDPDVQYLTWESYMHKRLVRRKPAAHMRVFFKDVAHLCGFART